MSFTTKHNKKTGSKSFTYKGDLRETIEKAKEELKKKESDKKRDFLLWQYQKAKKEFDAYEQRISDLKAFIPVAENHLRKEAENEADK